MDNPFILGSERIVPGPDRLERHQWATQYHKRHVQEYLLLLPPILPNCVHYLSNATAAPMPTKKVQNNQLHTLLCPKNPPCQYWNTFHAYKLRHIMASLLCYCTLPLVLRDSLRKASFWADIMCLNFGLEPIAGNLPWMPY